MKGRATYVAALAIVVTAACGAASDSGGSSTTTAPPVVPSSTSPPMPSSTTSTTTVEVTTTASAAPTTVAGVELSTTQFSEGFVITGDSNWTMFEQQDFWAEITNEGSGEEGERDKIYFTTLQPEGSGWVDLLTDSPYLETGAPETTEVGGAVAQATNTSLVPGSNPQDTGCSGQSGACLIAALDPATSIGLVMREGMGYRVWVTEVGGAAVAVVAEAQTTRAPEWIMKVDGALRTLTWQGNS